MGEIEKYMYRQFVGCPVSYRVTHLLDSNLPLTSKHKFRIGLAWPALTWPGQNGTFVLMSTGGLNQRDVSPCISAAISEYLKS